MMSDKPLPPALTHLDAAGTARMVDVSSKAETSRVAVAGGEVRMRPETLRAIQAGLVKKGDVLTVARVAGIMAAKQTSALIPLCHPIALTRIDLDFSVDASDPAVGCIRIEATANTVGKTGVEMEALTAVSIAALTIYDMVKAIDRGMQIGAIRLLEKSGGKSGDFRAEDRQPGERNTLP
jgi:cyclic pyranopterin phosphate synthase